MTNSEILEKLEQQFGQYQALVFCGMNAYLHQLCYDDVLKSGDEDYHDHSYDADWWKNEYNKRYARYIEDNE